MPGVQVYDTINVLNSLQHSANNIDWVDSYSFTLILYHNTSVVISDF